MNNKRLSFRLFSTFTFITLITWENPKVLGVLCQERDKGQVYISYYQSQFHRNNIGKFPLKDIRF